MQKATESQLAAFKSIFSACALADLRHDSDGSLVSGLGHLVLNEEEHVLIVEQTDQVEGAKAGCTAQSQVPDHHRTMETKED